MKIYQDKGGRWQRAKGGFASRKEIEDFLATEADAENLVAIDEEMDRLDNELPAPPSSKGESQMRNKETGRLKWWVWLLIGLAILAILFGSCAGAGIWAYNKYFKAVAFVPPITAVAAAPTDTPASVAEPVSSGQEAAPPMAGECPTTLWAQQAIGIDVEKIDTEPCSWNWRGKVVTAKCPDEYICTWDTGEEGTKVFLGPYEGNLVAGTWRNITSYPANDVVHKPCELLQKEQAFGVSEVPSFSVEAGNFKCTDD